MLQTAVWMQWVDAQLYQIEKQTAVKDPLYLDCIHLQPAVLMAIWWSNKYLIIYHIFFVFVMKMLAHTKSKEIFSSVTHTSFHVDSDGHNRQYHVQRQTESVDLDSSPAVSLRFWTSCAISSNPLEYAKVSSHNLTKPQIPVHVYKSKSRNRGKLVNEVDLYF